MPSPGYRNRLLAVGGVTAMSIGSLALAGFGGRPALTSHSGNGVGGLPAQQVLARSAKALAAVRTLVVDGSLRAGTESISFGVRSSERGKAVSGTLTVKNGTKVVGPVAFVDLTSALYLEAGVAFWRQEISSLKTAATGVSATQLAAKLAGHWIEITGSEASSFASGFGGLTEPGKFAQSLLSGSGKLVKGAPRVVRGRVVVPITSSEGATIFVALTGSPVPVEIAGSAALGSSSVSVTALISYPSRLSIVAPAGALTLAAVAQSIAG